MGFGWEGQAHPTEHFLARLPSRFSFLWSGEMVFNGRVRGSGMTGSAREWHHGVMSATNKTAGTTAASHDSDVTPELRRYMTKGWEPRSASAATTAAVAPYAAKRRQQLSELFPGETIVVSAGRPKVRSNDSYYPFRAHSAYVWLTGHQGESGVLVMAPRGKVGHDATLFVWPPSDRSTDAFYRDRNRGELWVGPRPSLAEISTTFDLPTRSLSELPKRLDALMTKGGVRRVRGVDPTVDDRIRSGRAKADAELNQALSELRLVKDDWEIGELEKAVAGTKRGFEDVISEIPRAGSERWLEGTFLRRARLEGNDVGYGSIVACGHHACTLHWTDNDGPVKRGELGLLDMGVETHSLYTADVTRTLPLSGRFTPVQRRVYNAVLAAQKAGIAAVQPGAAFMDPNVAAMSVLLDALIEWGVLSGDRGRLLKAETYRRYTLHNVSHMLGLDVHDCAEARNEVYKGGPLVAGMVLTVEPGLYFQRDDLTVPAELRGIGVRIEDDVLVTADGCRVLSADIPKVAKEVEQWMAATQK